MKRPNMMNDRGETLLPVFARFAVLAILVGACTSDPTPLEQVTPNDAGVVVAADAEPPQVPDVGPPPEPDAGLPPDLGPDAGRVDRTLTEYRPFGTMSVRNLVLSPTLDSASAVGPRSFRGRFVRRFRFRQSPTDTPAARISPNDAIFFFTQTHGVRLEAELWLGWPANTSVEDASAVLVGVTALGTEEQFAFRLITDEVLTLDGIDWRRVAATIDERLFGTATIIVGNGSNTEMFINGPSVVAATVGLRPSASLRAAGPLVAGSPVAERWRPVVDYVKTWSRKYMDEHLRPPPPLGRAPGPR